MSEEILSIKSSKACTPLIGNWVLFIGVVYIIKSASSGNRYYINEK